jgi:phosphoenolpyruvate phosphomutase
MGGITDKARKLRELFEQDGISCIAGAHNALGAKLVEKNGFDGVWASGLEISTAYAVPDANILTMSEFLNAAEAMNEAVSIPVIADCDTGFGNSGNVIYMVKKYENAGIAAVCIEDKHFPKVNSLYPGRQELASIAEFVGKIMAAKNAQRDKDFMVIARVEALIAGWGMDEALKRAHAYVDAGADAILIHSKQKTPNEIIEFAKAWENRVPLVVVPTTYFSITVDELEDIGVKMVIYANHGLRAAIKAMDETLGIIAREGTTRNIEGKIADLKEVFEIQGMQKFRESESRYCNNGKERVVAVIPAAGDHLEEYSMKHIAEDIPMAMLDINGKSLLQRQIETLNRAGIYDIYVVGGYKVEKIEWEGINLLVNERYNSTGILYSIMCASDKMNGKVLIAYSDVLYDKLLVERLLESDKDIVILGDMTFDSKNYPPNKVIDLIITETKPQLGRRILHSNSTKRVLKIGTKLNPQEAHYEFPGLMVLSPNGVKIFKEIYEELKENNWSGGFHEAESFEKANLSDMLQEIIDRGYEVSCLEVNSGWLELHSFEDYKFACSYVK